MKLYHKVPCAECHGARPPRRGGLVGIQRNNTSMPCKPMKFQHAICAIMEPIQVRRRCALAL